jgi:hypothetical protein
MSIHIWYYEKEKEKEKKNHKVVSQSFYWLYGDECPIRRFTYMLMLTSQFYCWAYTKHWPDARASRPMSQSDE